MRLLLAALRLFSEQGYDRTTIRAIAAEAQANVAAVHYYFGDKAALYAALFSEPAFSSMASLVPDFTRPGLSLRAALQRFFQGALAPLHHGELARQMAHLYMREMLEPADQRQPALERDIDLSSRALTELLQRHLGLATPDDELLRLAYTIVGLALQLWCQQEALLVQQPRLLGTPEAMGHWIDGFTRHSLAMVAAERRRRRAAHPSPSPAPAP
ncbi:TetR family transcriptional regulator [Melaminivora alkalimesophila]|uniref:TetR family transcriptional regulator n=3 Tax=Melaminivora alkalimesophila TaxID=1165852 RepID=A0A317RFW9_9BURK|nr:TetR family transcriptional regulator [Melaminivora alkalimesophila]